MSKRWKSSFWLLIIIVMSHGRLVKASENTDTAPSYESDFTLRSERLENGERSNTGESGLSSRLFSDEMTQKVEAYEKSRQKGLDDMGNRIFSGIESKAEVLDTNKLFAEKEEGIVYAVPNQNNQKAQDESPMLLFALLGVLITVGAVYVSYLFLRGAQ